MERRRRRFKYLWKADCFNLIIRRLCEIRGFLVIQDIRVAGIISPWYVQYNVIHPQRHLTPQSCLTPLQQTPNSPNLSLRWNSPGTKIGKTPTHANLILLSCRNTSGHDAYVILTPQAKSTEACLTWPASHLPWLCVPSASPICHNPTNNPKQLKTIFVGVVLVSVRKTTPPHRGWLHFGRF